MKVRNGGHVPGAAGHRTREKTARVIDKVGYNHFDDLQGKSDSRGRACRGSLRRSIRETHFPDSGLTPVPNPHGEQLDHCD